MSEASRANNLEPDNMQDETTETTKSIIVPKNVARESTTTRHAMQHDAGNIVTQPNTPTREHFANRAENRATSKRKPALEKTIMRNIFWFALRA